MHWQPSRESYQLWHRSVFLFLSDSASCKYWQNAAATLHQQVWRWGHNSRTAVSCLQKGKRMPGRKKRKKAYYYAQMSCCVTVIPLSFISFEFSFILVAFLGVPNIIYYYYTTLYIHMHCKCGTHKSWFLVCNYTYFI